jgi:hypothetical protein
MIRLTEKPTYAESAAGLVFEFHPQEPQGSLFRIVESPTGDPRVHLALVPLSFPGTLILGGENPSQPRELFVTGEVYLKEERRLAPLAVPLAIPRTRFGAFAVEAPGRADVYILGGSSPDVDPADFSEVERLRIEKRR